MCIARQFKKWIKPFRFPKVFDLAVELVLKNVKDF